jgi:hypothetical protein
MHIHVYNVCPISQDSTLSSRWVIAKANRPTVIRVSGDAAIQQRLCTSQDVRFPLQFFICVERVNLRDLVTDLRIILDFFFIFIFRIQLCIIVTGTGA